MQQYPNDPASQGTPQWGGQPGTPPAPPAWGGQQGVPQGGPAWGGQGAAPSFNVQAVSLDQSGSSWPALHLIARILKIIGWVALVFGVLGALGGGIAAAQLIGFLGFLLVFIFTLVITAIECLVVFGYAELILVFLAIEKNTRKN